MVVRFNFINGKMVKSDFGGYVFYENYQRLEAELAEADRMLKILMSVKVTDPEGNISLELSEAKYQEACAFRDRPRWWSMLALERAASILFGGKE